MHSINWPRSQCVASYRTGICKGHGFESRWSPDFFRLLLSQLLKLENLLRWPFFTFIYNRSSNMNYFVCTSHHNASKLRECKNRVYSKFVELLPFSQPSLFKKPCCTLRVMIYRLFLFREMWNGAQIFSCSTMEKATSRLRDAQSFPLESRY